MVSSYVKLLEKRYKGRLDEQADKYIHYAVDGAFRMHALINDLLAYSRVTSNGLDLRPVPAGAVAARVVDDLAGALTESGGAVEIGSLPTVLADGGQLRQVFQNLIGNGLKFARPGEAPRVSVSAAPAGPTGGYVFTVRDRGIGIEPQHFQRIFELFERLHGRGEYPGTGIGLAIVKKIVERHGGDIRVESQPCEGTAFHFTLQGAAE